MAGRPIHLDNGGGDDGGAPIRQQRLPVKPTTRIRNFLEAARGSIPGRINAALERCRTVNKDAYLDMNLFEERQVQGTSGNHSVVIFVIDKVKMGGGLMEKYLREQLEEPTQILFNYPPSNYPEYLRAVVTWEEPEFWAWWERDPANSSAARPAPPPLLYAYPAQPTEGALTAFGRRCVGSTTGKMAIYLTITLVPLTWYTFVKCRPENWEGAERFYTTILAFFTEP